MDDIYMPQVFVSKGGQLNSGPRLLHAHPEHARGIANVLFEWAGLEDQLIHSFTFCLFAFQGESGTSGNIARLAWYNLESIRSRLDLLEAIAKQRLPPNMVDEYTETIAPRVRVRSKERNRVAHAHWHVCKDYPKHVIAWSPEPKERLCYTVKDFHEISERMIDTANLVATFFGRIQDATKPEVFRELERALQERLSRECRPIPPDKSHP